MNTHLTWNSLSDQTGVVGSLDCGTLVWCLVEPGLDGDMSDGVSH